MFDIENKRKEREKENAGWAIEAYKRREAPKGRKNQRKKCLMKNKEVIWGCTGN